MKHNNLQLKNYMPISKIATLIAALFTLIAAFLPWQIQIIFGNERLVKYGTESAGWVCAGLAILLLLITIWRGCKEPFSKLKRFIIFCISIINGGIAAWQFKEIMALNAIVIPDPYLSVKTTPGVGLYILIVASLYALTFIFTKKIIKKKSNDNL